MRVNNVNRIKQYKSYTLERISQIPIVRLRSPCLHLTGRNILGIKHTFVEYWLFLAYFPYPKERTQADQITVCVCV